MYRYSDVVTSSYGRGFLTPRDSARQRCLSHELIIEPEAADSSTSRDAYGNISSYFHVTERHQTLIDHQPARWSRSIRRRPSCTAAGRRGRRGRSPGRSASTARWPPSSPSTCSRPRSPTRYVITPHRVSTPGRPLIEVLRDLDVADLLRLHLPVRVDDGVHAGQRGFGGAGRGMSGLRPAGDRLPARQRIGGQLRVGLSGDRPAAGQGTHGRHRRHPRLGVGVDAAEPVAGPGPDQRPDGRRALHRRRMGSRLRGRAAAARHHLHRLGEQRDRRRRRRGALTKGESCMRDFLCPNCGQHLAFENSVCLSCGSAARVLAGRDGACW